MLILYSLLLSSYQASNVLVIPEACHTDSMTGLQCCQQITANCSSAGYTHCNVVDTSGGTKVTRLILENCSYVGIPPNFSSMYSLVDLDLSDNFFSTIGNLSFVEGLSALNFLDLSGMSSTLHGQNLTITGNFPSEINKLDLNGNDLIGTIPSSLFNSEFIAIDLSGNQLTGPLPPELSSAINLEYLNLSSNPLGGSLVSLTNLAVLELLDLSNCSLSGDINIAGLPNLHELKILNLMNNELGGNLPKFGESDHPMTYLEEINLSENKLTGSIPSSSYINLLKLNVLDLSNNLLTGGVPSNFGEEIYLLDLWWLDLSANQLTGKIPSNLGGDASPLWYLDLSNNLLSGSIPKTLYSVKNLYHFDVSDNSLTGGLPELDNSYEFSVIEYLAVNNNSIGGEFPTTFGQLSNTLAYLDLGFNYFSGSIPESFSSFAGSTGVTLNLGGNLALTCPVTDYSNYAEKTDWGSYGTSGTENCGHTYASPRPTQAPNHGGGGGGSGKPMSPGFIILIIIGVFSVITGIIYWRWNAGKMDSAVHERLKDDVMDAVSYEDYGNAAVTDYKTAGTVGKTSIVAEAKRRNELTS